MDQRRSKALLHPDAHQVNTRNGKFKRQKTRFYILRQRQWPVTQSLQQSKLPAPVSLWDSAKK